MEGSFDSIRKVISKSLIGQKIYALSSYIQDLSKIHFLSLEAPVFYPKLRLEATED